jgi:hypothetical protein
MVSQVQSQEEKTKFIVFPGPRDKRYACHSQSHGTAAGSQETEEGLGPVFTGVSLRKAAEGRVKPIGKGEQVLEKRLDQKELT